MEILSKYWPFFLLSAWLLYKWWNSKKIFEMLPELKNRGAVFIDVRTANEYALANSPLTINIPLNEINERLEEIPQNAPLVLCCASGSRSGMAKMLLKKKGHAEVYNIGAWTKVR